MSELYLVRHAQSFANIRDFTAFGNIDSPLTDRGIGEAEGIKKTFQDEYGIDPDMYDKPVAVSAYKRPQQTAELAGFQNRIELPLINESDVDRDILSGTDVIRKHQAERWVPDETKARASEFFDGIRSGELPYEICFTHGMFIAGFLLECGARSVKVRQPFTEDRGYVPKLARIIKITL